MDNSSTSWRYFDFWLLGAVALLAIFGVAMINSAIAGNIELEEANIVQRQIIFVVLGLVVVLVTAAIDYRLWASISRPLYLGTIGLLGILFVVGATVFGSARWFETRYLNIQPSELAKIVMIIVLADFFTRHRGKIHRLPWVLRSLLFTLGVVVLILVQPNLSTAIVIMVIWFGLVWFSGLRLKHLALFGAAGAIFSVSAFPLLEGYQQKRIMDFLFPDPDARWGDTYNVQQALISIGSGDWFGKGYSLGSQVQLRFLKVRHSDFIFSAMAEEFGFVGTAIVMFLLLFVIFRCLRAARLSRDIFGSLICFGVATLLAFQTIVNIGVNLNMIPVTGLTLPFVSYGGSSLLSLMLGIGLVQSVVLRQKGVKVSEQAR
jgi:rod shape determining protein RodA